VLHSLRGSRMAPIWVLLATLILLAFAAGRMAQPATNPPTGMVAAFVDANGNGIDDTCETAPVQPDEDAAKAAEAAVDSDGDGTISVSEAAHSDRIGGTNCNHGGYVSWVAQGSCADPTPIPAEPALVTGPEPGDTTEEPAAEATTCDEQAEEATDEATEEAADEDTQADETCDEVAPPERDPALDDQKNGHGKWVSTVAQSDAIGGKNCNHGGAVSEAAKKDHEADKAARNAAKAERKAAREAAKAAREHGKGKPGSD
jgi:hypothetical protein